MNVIVTGGGTAGHVFPALATAIELRDHHDAQVTYIGAEDGPEARLVPAAGFPFVGVRVAAAQTRVSLASLRALALAFRGARSCRALVDRADVVVSIGGFASAPAVLAARRARRPLVLIEQNSVPGLVNRFAARWAVAVATTFDAAAARLPSGMRIERTGNPIRTEIAAVPANRARLRAEAREAFELEEGRTTVLVVGGSQGALHIDQAVAGALAALRDRADLQLLISTGPGHEDVVRAAVEPNARLLVCVVPLIERMDRALALADLVVSRAGAGVAELAACGLPSILIPYPHATEDHQAHNAREVVAAGAATMLPDAELSSSRLVESMLGLVDHPEQRAQMSDAATRWARPDAARSIARLVLDVVGEHA